MSLTNLSKIMFPVIYINLLTCFLQEVFYSVFIYKVSESCQIKATGSRKRSSEKAGKTTTWERKTRETEQKDNGKRFQTSTKIRGNMFCPTLVILVSS